MGKRRDLLKFFDFLKRFYLFFRKKGKEGKERERNIDWLPLTCPQMGTRFATQTCALTGNRTSDLSVHRLTSNPLSHTSQGLFLIYQFVILFWKVKLEV